MGITLPPPSYDDLWFEDHKVCHPGLASYQQRTQTVALYLDALYDKSPIPLSNSFELEPADGDGAMSPLPPTRHDACLRPDSISLAHSRALSPMSTRHALPSSSSALPSTVSKTSETHPPTSEPPYSLNLHRITYNGASYLPHTLPFPRSDVYLCEALLVRDWETPVLGYADGFGEELKKRFRDGGCKGKGKGKGWWGGGVRKKDKNKKQRRKKSRGRVEDREQVSSETDVQSPTVGNQAELRGDSDDEGDIKFRDWMRRVQRVMRWLTYPAEVSRDTF